MPTSKTQEQHELGETLVENTDLQALLEERETLKDGAAQYRSKDKEVKTARAGVETPTPFRIGRFVIDRRAVAAKDVSFSTDAGYRLNIKADE